MESESKVKVTYNERLERLIADEGERTQGLSWLHEQSSNYYQKKNTLLALPIIVLSTISGTLSASSTALFSDLRASSLGVGALSIFIGVLSTIQSYFGFAKRAENHRLSGISYNKLNHFITIEMALPRKERLNAHQLLKIVREQTGRLLETAPPIPEHVVEEFKRRFIEKYPNVAHPDITNGLRSIQLAPVVVNTEISNPPALFSPDAFTLNVGDKSIHLPPSPMGGNAEDCVQN